jgi:hypothetical protein
MSDFGLKIGLEGEKEFNTPCVASTIAPTIDTRQKIG